VKVLTDVHIAKKVVRFFHENGVECIHINDILDGWHTKDKDLSKYADSHGFVVMTKDADFKDSHFIKNSPKKLLKVSLGNIPTAKLLEILEKNLMLLQSKFDQEKCYIEINKDSVTILED